MTDLKVSFLSKPSAACNCYGDKPKDASTNCSGVCAIELAARGNVDELEHLYSTDPSTLRSRNSDNQLPVHVAAMRGNTAILEFIALNGGDLNVQDNSGNTPLHLAVENSQITSANFLLQHGSDASILNLKEMAPIHVACDLDNVESLEALLHDAGTDVDIRGEQGQTPLHYCAVRDSHLCAKKLLEYGSKPCKKCYHGFYPAHIAAKNGAAATLDLLIKNVESLGYKRETLFSFVDKENNMPLHSAVNSGDIKAVEVCLEAGAPMDAQQNDMSTPLHYACSQGNMEMIQVMYNIQRDRFLSALQMVDILKMSPLHRASMFDHVMIVDFLIRQGADRELQDSQQRTPLLLAACKGGTKTVSYLLKNSANVNVKDKTRRNFLHLAIKSGIMLDTFKIDSTVKNLLNEKDDFGCTPLHYASREGYLVAIDDLIKLGATINIKNNDKQSPFHFAAKYGRVNTCKRLLESVQGPIIINEIDRDGLSALHIASQNGHTKILALLLQRGATLTRDFFENTPLHLAAANGYTQSMQLLLNVYPYLLDAPNDDDETALHVAARNGHPSAVSLLMTINAKFTKNKNQWTFFDYAIEKKNTDVAMAIIAHDRWKEAMEVPSVLYSCPMGGLIKQLPEVCMALLDRCQTMSSHDNKSRSFYTEYNFKYLQCPLSWIGEQRRRGGNYTPMFALNAMVKHGRVDCLSHPVCVSFLRMKWRAYGSWFHLASLLIYLVFLAFLTYFIANNNSMAHMDSWERQTNSTVNTNEKNTIDNYPTQNQMKPMNLFTVWIITVFCLLSVVKEIYQMLQQKKKYFNDPGNILEWTLYLCTLYFIGPFIAGRSTHEQWSAGALAVFMAWFNCLVFLQRFDFFGIYVVMFLEIAYTLFQVLCVFSILIVAFGLSFYMLMAHEKSQAYSTPPLSLLRTGMMMLELDFMASFNEPYTDEQRTTLHFSETTIFLLVLFVLLMPILLMNLLIGLAVGDIESVLKNARLKRLAMQVEMHTDLERKLPPKLLEKVDKEIYRVYPNCTNHLLQSFWSKVSWFSSGDNLSTDLIFRYKPTTECNHFHEEMLKQKIRMKEISVTLDKQHELLRLIVQKMEIRTEEDFRDEGISTSMSLDAISEASHFKSRWSSPSLRNQLVHQSAVISNWQKHASQN